MTRFQMGLRLALVCLLLCLFCSNALPDMKGIQLPGRRTGIGHLRPSHCTPPRAIRVWIATCDCPRPANSYFKPRNKG